MVIKDELKYSKDHEWLATIGETATIGITDFAQGELGDVVYVELPEIGAEVTANEPFGTIEAVKAVAELFAPVSGTVTEVNQRLVEDAGVINSDCYGDGWMIKLTMSVPAQMDALLTPGEYAELTETQ